MSSVTHHELRCSTNNINSLNNTNARMVFLKHGLHISHLPRQVDVRSGQLSDQRCKGCYQQASEQCQRDIDHGQGGTDGPHDLATL